MREIPLELAGIRKAFGAVHALRGVDFALAAGEVHALLGENGAGKSTLLHVAYGMTRLDAGVVRVDGHAVTLHSPRQARALGVGMVHQHFTTIEALTVRENIRLAVGPRGKSEISIPGLDSDARVSSLNVAQRQRLEIGKARATGARILLLDEPTALLTPGESEILLAAMRAFAREGGAVALITHKLPEALAGADRVTVLRHGVVTFTGPVEGRTEGELAGFMVGGRIQTAGRPDGRTAREKVAEVGGISILSGDLIGVAAVEGNGQRELLRALAGLDSTGGQDVRAEGPVAFVPEDRTTEGLIGELSLTENVVLGLPDDPRWARGMRLDWSAARRRTEEMLDEFSVRSSGPDAPAATLSGGNQQKVVLARALERRPRLLVAENPTRGLDIRATAEVHERLRAAAAAGTAVVVYSTDLDEVLELGRRILVVHRGEVREAPEGAGRKRVGEMMLGVGDPSRRPA
ncbi:MAG: ABC transporter ATP-binding protein [Gemmatimonadales bacterium]